MTVRRASRCEACGERMLHLEGVGWVCVNEDCDLFDGRPLRRRPPAVNDPTTRDGAPMVSRGLSADEVASRCLYRAQEPTPVDDRQKSKEERAHR